MGLLKFVLFTALLSGTIQPVRIGVVQPLEAAHPGFAVVAALGYICLLGWGTGWLVERARSQWVAHGDL